MGISTPPTPVCVNSRIRGYNSIRYSDKQSLLNSMSQDYQQAGTFSFSNGSFERSQQEQQQRMAQQIRKDKLRMQGFEPPPPLVGMEEEEESGGVLPVYETAGMLQEMFNFPSGGVGTAAELLENQISQEHRIPRTFPPTGPASAADWFLHRQAIVGCGGLGDSKNQHNQISDINADSAAVMQLFLMNPQQQRSPSPSRSQNPLPNSSTIHMLLPNQSSSPSNLQAFHNAPGGGYGQFDWIPNSGNITNPNEIPGVVEGQGLSLSLSSSLQQFEAAKAEEMRMEDGGMLFFGKGGGSTSATYRFKNMVAGGGGGGTLRFQGGVDQNHQSHDGLGSHFGAVNILRNSKYSKAAQELLEEFCSVGRGQFKKIKFKTNPSSGGAAGGGNSSSPSKDLPPLSAADRVEHQKKKVDRRYNHYCEQMQMVVNSFDMVMGFGAAVSYTCLAQKAMSWHFRCLKDAISAQIKQTCELLGDKDAGTSCITKGETPRLRILEQSLRQQRAFHHMGIMEQEAWRPQRGLPERSVNILRAWLFEHFLHPYPGDADKHLLARQTGLSRNQVSNWFINARVRLWKPMVEEMYQQESKEEAEESQRDHSSSSSAAGAHISTNAQTPKSHSATTPAAAVFTPPPGKRSEISATENDPSFMEINRQRFPETQAMISGNMPFTASHSVAPPESDAPSRNHADVESTLRGLGVSAGDVSLTLGLRHAGNISEKNPFSGC
ncbi:BEL1-like homeodomain protein 2 isoform X2 [Primulina huaijiensis]|uniref:BEL1-like homeodomain protein 2 isoform X2 n=1 Tax=Primulina huaijiensis TaxID=1492673 RepID=UPI003CC6EE1A